MITADERSLLQLFAEVVPPEWREWQEGQKRTQIYTLPVVVAMMLLQRLNERGTQQEAVHQVAAGGLDHLLADCKRVQEGKISANTGGYARACGRIRVEVLERACDQMLEQLRQRIEPQPEMKVPLLLLDGSSLSLEHTQGLVEDFPPAPNQYGEGHWGIVRWVAFHDLQTGIALRPAWGAMFGDQAVGEQQLAEQVIALATAGSVIMGDGNFGVFSVAYAVVQHHHQVLFRLTKQRAQALGAGKLLPTGERKMVWSPSRSDRKAHPDLPQDAKIEGRLIVVTQNGFREALYLFTTLPDPAEKVVAWYAQRWNMELDLRTLKGTMRLQHLRGKTTEAVEKELLIAVVAYGLVRAFMALAARRAGLDPRRLSFTRAYGLLNAMVYKLCAVDVAEREQAYDRILDYMSQAKLPNRSKSRKYPRAVWYTRQEYPSQRAQKTEAQSK
jgi:putative transposase